MNNYSSRKLFYYFVDHFLVYWFGHVGVKSRLHYMLYVRLVIVCSHCKYFHIVKLSILNPLPYFSTSFISVHHWHIDVHENEIVKILLLIFHHRLFNLVDCLSSVVGRVDENMRIALKKHFKHNYIKRSVIHHQ